MDISGPMKPGISRNRTISRRTLLAGIPALGAAGLAGAGIASGLGAASGPRHQPQQEIYGAVDPADGNHQAGIATPRPSNVALAAFDVTTLNVSDLSATLQTWTIAIRKLANGELVDAEDSGETDGMPPAKLTITVGFGPSLFDSRFGLAGLRPAPLVPLPSLPGNKIDSTRSDGDIVVQACAENEIVATHAIRQLTRLGAGSVRLRWSSTGASPSTLLIGSATPRNLLGFKDGTGNPAFPSATFDSTVWANVGSSPEWLATGGTYLCYRKIRIDLDAWDALTVADQQVVIGRTKSTGSPLSGGNENTPIDLTAVGRDGSLAIPPDSHVRLAAAQLNDGAQMFRRSFAYDDGTDLDTSQPSAGLLFLAWVAEPSRQFVPILKALSQGDRLGQFITHIASGIWAVPPSAHVGASLAQGLLE